MYCFKSSFGAAMNEFIKLRCAQGYLRRTYFYALKSLDDFCLTNYPQATILTSEIVHAWLKAISQHMSLSYLYNHSCIIRNFSRYLSGHNMETYILPDKFITNKRQCSAYIFTDEELKRLFYAIDTFQSSLKNPFSEYQLPVLFRLIYTCGLRPKEGRMLLCDNVNINTGEILITNTKYKRDRLVIMSDDMLSLYRKYDELRKKTYPNSVYAFPAVKGNEYSSNWLCTKFSECWAAANPQYSKQELPRVRIYDLRHMFASTTLQRWLNEKRDLKSMLLYLQLYMGHCKLSHTAQYIHMLPEHLIKSSGIKWSDMNSIIPEVSR